MARPTVCFLVAVADHEVVGSVIGTFDGWRGNMYRLVVHPAYRRLGLARTLVSDVEAVLLGWGVERVSALVEQDHEPAMRFWEAAGYTRNPRMIRHVRALEAVSNRTASRNPSS
jgi:ribosomal protein S18 acetylase RimI-like enzyme